MKIKKGDNIIVIAGKNKGTQAKVLVALPELDQVIVEGVNMQKRHLKANRNTKQGGQVIDKAMPVHVSNVMLVDPKTGKPTRVSRAFDAGKKKRVRITKKSGTVVL